MGLVLGISTSSNQFEVIFGENSTILFHYTYNLSSDKSKDISDVVVEGLEKIGKSLKDIEKIMVDIGAGGTSLVRTGVAFANGLSYSLNIPIFPVLSSELIGFDLWEKYQLPIIHTIKSIKENAFVALFKEKHIVIEYGNLYEVVEKLVADYPEFVVAGYHREKIITHFSHKKIHDSTLQVGDARVMIEKNHVFDSRSLSFPNFAIPITEDTVNHISFFNND